MLQVQQAASAAVSQAESRARERINGAPILTSLSRVLALYLCVLCASYPLSPVRWLSLYLCCLIISLLLLFVRRVHAGLETELQRVMEQLPRLQSTEAELRMECARLRDALALREQHIAHLRDNIARIRTAVQAADS